MSFRVQWFTGVDPLAVEFPHLSVYNYASNNPIANYDLWGLQGVNFNTGDVDRMQIYFRDNASSGFDRDDCITCHNKGMRILLNNNSVPVGSQADQTRSKMQEAGYANETISFGFTNASGDPAIGNGTAEQLDGDIGQAVLDNSTELDPGESTVFGVSIMDGYHTMTVTATRVLIDAPPDPNKNETPLDVMVFTLSDQGTETTDGAGNKMFFSKESFNSHLESYVTDRQDVTTWGGYEYPAKIEIHQIKQEEQ